MDIQSLTSMANRLGQVFGFFSDSHEALRESATNIHKLWKPHLRRELLAHWDGR